MSTTPRLTVAQRPSSRTAGRGVHLPHLGALDGLRGLAVIAVILFHGGVGWAHGGFLGVEVFFVLSGFLITSLLLGEWLRTGAIALRAFWARRARRLLPALVAMALVVGIYYAAVWPTQTVPGLSGDALSALLYFSNWHQIANGTSYFAGSGPISPFQHTWSLAIEEQFYAVWPLVVLGVLWLAGRRGLTTPCGRLRLLLVLTVTGAIASAVETALLFAGGSGLDRVYYGTDTRAGGLLVGAALAIGLAWRREASRDDDLRVRPRWRAGAGIGAALAFAGLLGTMDLAWGSSAWLFPYGMVALDLAVAVIIATIVLVPETPVARLLSAAPLRATGRISYGLYLWHFPLFLWLSVAATGVSGMTLLLVRLAVTLVVSVLSYVLIEQPIRRRRPHLTLSYGLATIAGAGAIASLVAASAATMLSGGVAVADRVPVGLAGDRAACVRTLRDTRAYGLAPVPASRLGAFEGDELGAHELHWGRSATVTFHTCRPKRIMLIGDSIAFALGTPMLDDEQRYGVELADAATLGCAFGTRGELGVDGTWARPDDGCADPLVTWARDERRFHPAEVMIELGYRDEFDWRWGDQIVHLGQPRFDAYVQSQIDDYVRVLGRHGVKLLFLSVPYTDPPDQADGAPAPAASPRRHQIINAMLRRAARGDHGDAAVLDLDPTISPGGHYDPTVDGRPCRMDGIHPNEFCATLVEPRVLTEARELLTR